MLPPHQKERRQAFRLDDQALVDIRLLDQQPSTEPLDQLLPHSDGFQLLSELQQVDQQLQHQLFKLADTSPTLATALRLINNKIETLALYASNSHSDSSGDSEPQPITLSTTGLSLSAPDLVEPGTYCALRLRLLPGSYAVQMLAKVVYCQQHPEGDYRIGLVFIDPNEAEQDLIAGHILQQQALSRRNERQQQTDNELPI